MEKLHIGNAFCYESDLCGLNAIGIYITLREQLTKGAEVKQVTLPQPPTNEQIQKLWKEIQLEWSGYHAETPRNSATKYIEKTSE